MASYRRKHRTWTMEYMPSMDNAQWEQYTRWVSDFGQMYAGAPSHGSNKTRRRLKATRVTAKVTPDNFTVAIRAPVAGPACGGGATRRK